MSMYIRVKRKNQTIFLHVEPSESFLSIKQRLATLMSMEPYQMNLIGNDKKKELVDLATVSDQEVKNDDIIYVVFSKTSGGWEEPDADNLVPFGDNISEDHGAP